MKTLKPSKSMEQLSFLEFKILVWFKIIGYTIQDHTLHFSLIFTRIEGLLSRSLYGLCYSESPITRKLIETLTDRMQKVFPHVLFYNY